MSTACYKCGKTGHFSRDCRAGKNELLTKEEIERNFDLLKAKRGTNSHATTTTNKNNNNKNNNNDDDGVDDDDDFEADLGIDDLDNDQYDDDGEAGLMKNNKNNRTRTATAKKTNETNTTGKKQRKPKFSIEEHLLGPNGLEKIWKTFADEFDEHRKKDPETKKNLPGFEHYNMGLILQMYENWAREMYPWDDAKVTLERVRKLKNNAQVKAALSAFHDLDLDGEEGARQMMMGGDDDDGGGKKASSSKNMQTKSKKKNEIDYDDLDQDVEFPDDDDEEEEDVEFPDDDDEDNDDEDEMDALREAEGLPPRQRKSAKKNKKAENLFDDAMHDGEATRKEDFVLPSSDDDDDDMKDTKKSDDKETEEEKEKIKRVEALKEEKRRRVAETLQAIKNKKAEAMAKLKKQQEKGEDYSSDSSDSDSSSLSKHSSDSSSSSSSSLSSSSEGKKKKKKTTKKAKKSSAAPVEKDATPKPKKKKIIKKKKKNLGNDDDAEDLFDRAQSPEKENDEKGVFEEVPIPATSPFRPKFLDQSSSDEKEEEPARQRRTMKGMASDSE